MLFIGNITGRNCWEALDKARHEYEELYPDAEEYGFFIATEEDTDLVSDATWDPGQIRRVFGTVAIPKIKHTFVYNGEYQVPQPSDFKFFDEDKVIIDAEPQKEVGVYYLKLKVRNPVADRFMNGLIEINKDSTDNFFADETVGSRCRWEIVAAD